MLYAGSACYTVFLAAVALVLMSASAPLMSDPAVPVATPPRVLFTCSADGNRSLLAAALTAHLAGPGLELAWACSTAPRIHPFALAVLNERGVRAEGPRACLSGAAPEAFDLLIQIGGPAEPPLAGHWPARQTLRWTLANPLQSGPGGPSLQAFRYARDELERRAWQLLQHAEQVQPG